MNKIIGVACGGYTSEREISLKSGQVVYQAIRKNKYKTFIIDVAKDHWQVIDEQNNSYPLHRDKFTFEIDGHPYRFDCVVNMIHGSPGEDGQLAKHLENLKIPQTSCKSKQAALTYDKRACLDKANALGVPSAQRFTFDHGNPIVIDTILSKVGLPCFVKANRAGSSYGVIKVYQKDDLIPALTEAFKEDQQILIETALEGREITVGVMEWKGQVKVLPITEIISENDFFDYKAKYEGQSKEITPAKIPEEWANKAREYAKHLYTSLGLEGITRSEFIFQNGEPHLLEINTIPGMTLESIIPQQIAVDGISLPDLMHSIIETTLAKKMYF